MGVSAEQDCGSKCPQCGKEIEDTVRRKIFYRTRRDTFDSRKGRMVSKVVSASKVMSFCSARCGGHYQMAMEG